MLRHLGRCVILAILISLATNVSAQVLEPTARPDEWATADSNGKRTLVFLTNGDDPYWDICSKGMSDAAKQLKLDRAGLRVVVDKGSEFRVEKQIGKLEALAERDDIVAVAIAPVDSSSQPLADALRALRDRGVQVICVDSDMDREKHRDARFAYLGTNNVIGGEELGKAALGLRPGGGKYATFVGIKTVANATDRIGGFAKGAGKAFEALESLADQADSQKAQENVRTVLTQHADKVDTLVGIWSYNAHAIVRVVEERGLLDQQTILVFDASAAALKDMEQGKIDAMIAQNPYQIGHLSIRLMKALVEEDHESIARIFRDYYSEKKVFKTKDGDILDTELRIVVPNETSLLKKEMFRPETRFFYYKHFRKWLDDRDLASS